MAAIVHAHPQWSTYLTMTGHSYRPVYAQGALAHPAKVLDTPDSINSPEIAGRRAETLGRNSAALMKSHGAVTVGSDVREAFVLMNYFEENARRQYMAMQIGTPHVFAEDECTRFRERLWTLGLFRKAWTVRGFLKGTIG